MGNRDQSLFVGQAELGSQLRSAMRDGTLVVKETTADGISYLETAGTDLRCVLTDHDPPDRDCFQLLASVPPELPVILVPTEGSSELATRGLSAGASTYLDPTTVENGIEVIVEEIDQAGRDRPAAGSRCESDARIERFSRIVAHELRSPLQTVKSGIDLAQTDCESRYLDEVDATIAHMDQLIENLLDRLETDETTPELGGVDLAAVIRESWPTGTAGTLSVDDELPQIKAEQSRLQQLFENLFRNAIEHGGETVSVQLSVIDSDPPNGTIAIAIADDGPGIEPERRETVFEYGYTGSADGTGLGLAIVAEIVDDFGWEISVTDSPTGGAQFEICQINIL